MPLPLCLFLPFLLLLPSCFPCSPASLPGGLGCDCCLCSSTCRMVCFRVMCVGGCCTTGSMMCTGRCCSSCGCDCMLPGCRGCGTSCVLDLNHCRRCRFARGSRNVSSCSRNLRSCASHPACMCCMSWPATSVSVSTLPLHARQSLFVARSTGCSSYNACVASLSKGASLSSCCPKSRDTLWAALLTPREVAAAAGSPA